jgi:hypothetical protein
MRSPIDAAAYDGYPGFAKICIRELQAPVGTMQFRLTREDYVERVLGPDGWQVHDALLAPEAVGFEDGCIVLQVGPSVSQWLAEGSYQFAVPEADVSGTVAWPVVPPLPSGSRDQFRSRRGATAARATEVRRPPPPPPVSTAPTADKAGPLSPPPEPPSPVEAKQPDTAPRPLPDPDPAMDHSGTPPGREPPPSPPPNAGSEQPDFPPDGDITLPLQPPGQPDRPPPKPGVPKPRFWTRSRRFAALALLILVCGAATWWQLGEDNRPVAKICP